MACWILGYSAYGYFLGLEFVLAKLVTSEPTSPSTRLGARVCSTVLGQHGKCYVLHSAGRLNVTRNGNAPVCSLCVDSNCCQEMFPPQQIAALSQFIKILDQQPDLLHNDQLAFFRDYLTKLGATIPPAPKAEETSKTEEPKPAEKPVEPEPEEEMEEEEEEEPAEPDADLWTPDDDVPPITIDGASEVSEESMDKAMELKSEAMGLQSEGDFEGAVGKMTEALKLNPSIAMLYANRGHCYMKLKKPKAAIADCTAAISLNPNSAKAFKVRGKCYRHLGNYELAANDLRMGQQIDFDEDTAELHKLVEDKAKKIFEKKRCKERNARYAGNLMVSKGCSLPP